MKKFYFLLITLCATAIAYAQEQINVTVADLQAFKPIENAEVYIRNTAIGYLDSGHTNKQGQVSFNGLQLNGIYKIYTKENDGYFPSTSEDIVLRSNYSRSITLSLQQRKVTELQEATVVSHTTSRLNTQNAEVSSEMTIQEIEKLPVEGRDITRMLYRLPNISQATGFFSEAPNVSINGGNGLFNNYLIDGMDNNEQFLGGIKFPIPVGFTQNVSVLTNNYSAEFGLSENGIINVTPKSGTNELAGEVFFLTRPGSSLDGQTNYEQRDLSGNLVKQGFQRYQEGFGLGGALKKDKTFFYINYERTTDIKDNILTSPELGINQTVRGTNRYDLISAKIDEKWSDKWGSSFRGNVGIIDIGRQAVGLSGGVAFPSAANGQDRNSFTFANKNTYTSGNFTSETNILAGTFRWNYARPANPTSPDVTLLDPSGSPIASLGNPGYVFDDHQNTEQIQQKFIVKKGRHTFKFGGEVLSTGHLFYGGGNPNGSYIVQLDSTNLASLVATHPTSSLSVTDLKPYVHPNEILYYGIELRPNSYNIRQNIYSAYAEDQWAFNNRLNLNLGLRYDYDNLSKGGGTGDYNNIAPRFSFNYKLTDRSAIRGGYGMVYDKILYTVYSDAITQDNSGTDYKNELQYLKDKGILPSGTDINKVTYNGNQTSSTSNVKYLQPAPDSTYRGQLNNTFSGERRILNPDGYKNPYTHMFTLGYQYQINRKMFFYVDGVFNHSYDLYRLYNLNAPSAWDAEAHPDQARSTASADSTRPLPIYTDANGSYALINGQRVNGVARNVVITKNDGESKYYALSLNLQKDKGDNKYSYRLIYTLSTLRNNTEDVNFRAMDHNNLANEWGPSVNDRTHIINAIFNYYPVKNLTLTVAALIQSGQPINRVPNGTNYTVVDNLGHPVLIQDPNSTTPKLIKQTSNDLNGDGSSFGDAYVGNSDRYPGASRNVDRLPWSKNFDVSVQYRIPIKKWHSYFELRVDAFNVLNATNYSGYSNNATQSNQIQYGPVGGPIVYKNAGPPRQFQFGLRYAF